MASVESDALLSKRENIISVLNQLAQQVQETQRQLNTLTENYTVNRGALLQLNELLEELGIDLTQQEQPEPIAEAEAAAE